MKLFKSQILRLKRKYLKIRSTHPDSNLLVVWLKSIPFKLLKNYYVCSMNIEFIVGGLRGKKVGTFGGTSPSLKNWGGGASCTPWKIRVARREGKHLLAIWFWFSRIDLTITNVPLSKIQLYPSPGKDRMLPLTFSTKSFSLGNIHDGWVKPCWTENRGTPDQES